MMPPTTSSPIESGAGGGYLRGLVMPVTIVGAILVFVVPIPPAVLDVLLSANVTRGGARALDDAGDPHAAGIQRVSDDPADDHADAAGA